MTALLQIADLTVAYGEVAAVRDVSLDVGTDELVVVLGANGAGKSTLLNTVVGWLSPRTGTVRFDGEDLTGLQPWQRVERGLAVVPEGGRVFADFTVRENLAIARPSPTGLDLVRELFPVLNKRRNQLAKTLSGGQRQMLALGRALATEPRLLLIDEASTGLMPTLVDRLFEVFDRLRRDGLPILLVEQNTKALAIADRGYVMATGEIAHQGDAASLAEDPVVRRAYLGGDPADQPSE